MHSNTAAIIYMITRPIHLQDNIQATPGQEDETTQCDTSIPVCVLVQLKSNCIFHTKLISVAVINTDM